MQIGSINFNLLSFDRPSSLDAFFSGRVSKDFSCIPLVGTVIGISRIAFATYQYNQAAPGWTLERLTEEWTRGALETLCLGLLLLVYDSFFAKVNGPQGSSFAPVSSRVFSDHAFRLVAFYATKTPNPDQLRLYQNYLSSGQHPLHNQPIFQGADFFTRHGIMHACFVSMFVPIFISLYREAGHAEAAALTQEDILALQAVAFLHDYGRVSTSNDLCRDREALERIGQRAAYQYLKEAMGLSEQKALQLSQMILTKDDPLAGKSLLQQVLQNCDCLAVLRADDWQFDPQFLDFTKWVQTQLSAGPAQETAKQALFSVIDSAKRLLVEVGDSPYDMPCFSETSRGQIIAGRFSLAIKRTYEKNPQCHGMMLQRLQNYPALQSRL